MRITYPIIQAGIVSILVMIWSQSMAQCDFQEVMRADGTLNKNYEYGEVFTSDSLNIRMSLSYQGVFKSVRVEYEYVDTIKARSYRSIYFKMSDSTVVEMYFLSSSKLAASNKTICLYEIRQEELGYLVDFEIVKLLYNRKKGTRATLELSSNRDIIKLQLACTGRK